VRGGGDGDVNELSMRVRMEAWEKTIRGAAYGGRL